MPLRHKETKIKDPSLFWVSLCHCIFVVVSFSLSAQAEEVSPIIIEHADRAEFMHFSSEEGVATFEGSVEASFRDIRLEADWVKVDLENNSITACGDVTLQDPNRTIRGKEIVYDIGKESILTHEVEAEVEGLYIDGKEVRMEMDGKRKMVIKEGTFTTCSQRPPHYKVKTARVVIYPERNLWAYNVVLYLGDLPLFYSPIYYWSLRHKGPHLFISPGYSDRDGWYIKSKYRLYLEDDRLDLLLDYLQRRGFGKGLDYQYHFGRDARGEVSLYHISEEEILAPAYTDRWKLSLSHYQGLLEDLTLQGRFNYQSDELIDYEIEREGNPRTHELDSYLAATLRKTNYILRLSGKRKDGWDGQRYSKELEEIPRLTFWRRPLPIGPLYYQIKGDILNQYTEAEGGDSLSAGAEAKVFTRVNIGSPFTLSPEIGLWERFKGNDPGGKDGFETGYSTGLNLQARISRWFRCDLGHRFKKEIERFDSELEEVRGMLNLTFPRWCRIRTSTTYDLIGQEYEPLINELSLFLSGGFRFDATSRYHIEEGDFKSLDLRLDRDTERWEAGFGAYFVDTEEDLLDLEARLGLWLSSITKVKTKGRYDTTREEFEVWEVSLYQDLHCWELELGVRGYPVFIPTTTTNTEGWLRLNLKEF